MFKIPKQEYTDEFKDLAVKRVKDGEGMVMSSSLCKKTNGASWVAVEGKPIPAEGGLHPGRR